MPTNFFETARERAFAEIAEINSQIQALAHRKNLLEKLVQLLEEVDASPHPDGVAATFPEAPTAEEAKPLDVPAPAEEIQEVQQPEDAVHEAPTLASQLEKLHEYKQSQVRIIEEISEDLTAEGERSISHEETAQLAYRFWTERGCVHGYHKEDWFRAEAELRGVSPRSGE